MYKTVSIRKTFIIISFIFLGLFMFYLMGCSGKRTESETETDTKADDKESVEFVYKKPDSSFDFFLKKTIYKKNNLVVYFKGDNNLNGKKAYVKCFDKEGEEIKRFNASIKNNKILIKTSDPARVSGIYVYPEENYDYYYKIRYLDSDDYAILQSMFVYDLGWEDLGDTDKYLFDSEKKEIKENAQKAAQNEREAFEMIKGKWINQDDPDKTIDIFENDNGTFTLSLYDPEEDDTYDYYMESLYYYFDDYLNAYDITGSTGNMTAPVYLWISEDGIYLYEDKSFESPYIKPE